MSRAAIVPATPAHAREVATRMRTLDCQEIRERLGLSQEAYVLRSLERSSHAWAGLVDGRPICIMGLVHESVVEGRATAWLFTTPDVERYPKMFWRGSKAMIAHIRGLYPTVEGICDSRFEATVRWLSRLGFVVSPETRTIECVPFHSFEIKFNG